MLRLSGSVTAAAKNGEIGRSSWYELAERDDEFKMQWDDNLQEFLDGVEAEAMRRATIGILKVSHYIEYGQADGKETKQTKEHHEHLKSDRLIELILKARHPLYKPVKAVEVSSPDGSMSPTGGEDIDTDNLTDEELRQLVRLQRKLRGNDGKR